jgi:predicted dinucleotide-binding enzyme
MRIGVIGAGNIGGTLGGRWQATGHEVIYGLRDPGKREGARSIDEALGGAEVVLLAIPGGAVVDFVNDNAKALDGKTVIDATNNVRGAALNSWADCQPVVPNARLYRAFNIYGWDVFAAPTIGGQQPDLFYAGPDEGHEDVERLISDIGLRPVRVGDADQAGTVDGLLRLWFTLTRDHGRHIAFKLLTD